MVCSYCGGETEVYNSRLQKRSNQIWRRRRCKRCKATFTTHESLYLTLSYSVSRPGRSEPFVTERLFTDILLAVADRKDCYEVARELTATITAKLLKASEKPLFEPQTISQTAAEVLKRFDRQAWLRFIAEHPSQQGATSGRRGRVRS